MTEKQWLAARTANSLIDHTGSRDRRKLRLLAIACVRRMLAALPADPAFGGVVDAAEQYADDPALKAVAVEARKPLREAARRYGGASVSEPFATAVNVLVGTTGDVIEGFTAGIANSLYVMAHRRATVRCDGRAERRLQADLIRDIFGNPFRPVAFDPAWRTSTVAALAKQMYDSRDFGAMPILADALMDAGCERAAILDHCRDPQGVHVRGCWVVDLVLGKS